MYKQGERQRCCHAWPHTSPSRIARGACKRCMGTLGACQASCEALEPGAVRWLVPMEVCRWRGHLLAAWRPEGCQLSGPWLLLLLPADLQWKDGRGAELELGPLTMPQYSAQPEGHSHLPPQCTALAYNAMTGHMILNLICLKFNISVINRRISLKLGN